MNSANTHYTRTAQILHWLMAIIFIAAWLIGFYSGNFLSYDADGSFKGDVITLHKNIATTIIFLVVIIQIRIMSKFFIKLPRNHI